jgi:hypothetical protein
MSKWWMACAFLGACGWTMAQPTDVIQVSEELPISNRSSFAGALANESFKLGSYQIADVDRKWDRTDSKSFFGFEAAKTTGGYAYNLVSSDTKLKGECATVDSSGGQKLGNGLEYSKQAEQIGCRCSDSNGAMTLTVRGASGKPWEGEISAPELSYKVQAIHARAKGPSSGDPLGYRIDSDSAPIGAIDLKRPGKVWISKALDTRGREQVACLSAGLLLYLRKQEH